MVRLRLPRDAGFALGHTRRDIPYPTSRTTLHMTVYEHTQSGGTLVIVLLSSAILLVAALALLPREPAMTVVFLIVLGVMSLAAFLFRSLTVKVTPEEVVVWFGSGLIRRRIPAAEITGARAVRNPWWYGWGVKITPGGWMFNIAGLDAVEVDLREGKRFRIGTDEPEQLVSALRHVTGGRR